LVAEARVMMGAPRTRATEELVHCSRVHARRIQ
jgi:hypothetical protein